MRELSYDEVLPEQAARCTQPQQTTQNRSTLFLVTQECVDLCTDNSSTLERVQRTESLLAVSLVRLIGSTVETMK